MARDFDSFLFRKESDDAERVALTSIWDQLLNENKILPCWNNVNNYWKRFGLSSALLQYVEKNADDLVNDDSSSAEEGFTRRYLVSNGDNNAYRKLIEKLKIQNFDIPIADIPGERMAVLIDIHYIDFTVSFYDQVRSTYPSLLLSMILEYQLECIKFVNAITMGSELLTKLIKKDRATVELKEALLNFFGEEDMSEEVANELCNSSYAISKEVFFAAWEWLDENKRKHIMFRYLTLLNADDFEKCFADLKEYGRFCDRTRHNVELVENEENKELAKRLDEVDYITSWKPETRERKNHKGKVVQTESDRFIVCVVKAQK